jgi:small-conductance mechanosensitive channel
MLGTFEDTWNHLLGPDSPYRTAILTAVTLAAIYVSYKVTTVALRRYLNRKGASPDNAQRFLFAWRYVWFGVGLIFVIVSLSGSLAAMGISAAFLGMILGWSLQAPVTGIAAWLMVIVKRPFKIGDRIIIAGVIGDVVDISLTHIVLNQVGGTVGGEEKSGRGVMIPNATLFQQIIYNYAFESSYLLDEVAVLVTFESDLEEAERLCVEAAREVTGQIVQETGREPFCRSELGESGIRVRLRYQTVATDRQRISNDMVHGIVRRFNANDRVEFAYPHTEVLHRPKDERKGRDAIQGSA